MKALSLFCSLLVGTGLPSASAQVPDHFATPPPSFFGERTTPGGTPVPLRTPPTFTENVQRPASYLVTAAEDFVVEVYLNGRLVPLSQREMVKEVFGSIAEKVKVEVKPGDWIVFNVVNDPLRWGTCYFGVAGMGSDGKPVFVSRLGDPRWTFCDDLGKIGDFIAQRDTRGEPVRSIPNVWVDGPKLMREYAFQDWNGDPIWGKARNTWIKFVYR